MKRTITHMLALLTVFGASVAYAADSATVVTTCQVVAEEDMLYRLVYQAAQQDNVTINLIDEENRIVYQERTNTAAFNKKFDLRNLPYGEYQLEVKSEGYFFSEKLILGDVSSFNMDLNKMEEGKKISLVGSKVKGKAMTLYILDQSKDVIYKEEFHDASQINKKFNFDDLRSSKVTFLLYHNDLLIQEKDFVF